MALSTRRTVFALAIFSALPLLVACPQKTPPVVDAGPPPPPPEEASTQVLVPIEEDAGIDAADADAGKKVVYAPPSDAARIRQCCAAIKRQAGTAPELGVIVATCENAAAHAAAGPSPELQALKAALAGRPIPGCNF